MTLAVNPDTLIRAQSPAADIGSPIASAIHEAGRKLCAMDPTALNSVYCPTQDEAGALADDVRTIAKIFDEMLLKIGREARAHFGPTVSLSQFTGLMADAVEGEVTYELETALDEQVVF